MTIAADAPQVLEDLTEEEAYLFAILSDPSGLDAAEFLWVDHASEDNKFCPECGTARDGVHLHEHPDIEQEDWVLKYPAPSACFRAWAYQWPWWRDKASLSIDQCARSVGKALDVETPIPTPTGWTKMGDLNVGDKVFDEVGLPVVVTGAFDVQYGRPCYEVVFDDHSTIVADGDHQWLTWDKVSRAAAARGRSWHGPRVRTTNEMHATLRRGPESNHSIDVAESLETRNGCLPLNPYVLGYWLGDGDSAGERLTIVAEDQLQSARLLAAEGVDLLPLAGENHFAMRVADDAPPYVELPACGADDYRPKKGTITNGQVRELRIRAAAGERLRALAAEFAITPASVTQLVLGKFRRSAGGPVREDTNLRQLRVSLALTALGVTNDKHIPLIYMRASVPQRLALLQGLMDSDGHCRKDSRCEITLKSESLARQTFELLASLGQKPFFEKRRAKCNGVDAGPVYRVGFTPLGLQPFRLSRKAIRVQGDSGTRVSQRRVVAIRETTSRPVRCISVDGPSHLFLAGETMIPTHNSLSIKVRACAFPFLFPGQEMVITAPELVHLEPIVSLIESQVYATRVLREMITKGKSAVTHRPFQANFVNGCRIIGRIPQRDGRGVKGVHPIQLELDEAQDYPHAGWVELRETLKRGFAGAAWRAHGVTRGVRDDFYESTQDSPDNPWKIHRISAMWRPNWTNREREEALEKYGSREDPDYRRNILGVHGDKTNPIFVLTQLMKCADSDTLSDYNVNEYFRQIIKVEQLEQFDQTIAEVLDFPVGHLRYAGQTELIRRSTPQACYWIGMDVGFTIDPSEILVFVEYRDKPKDEYTRIKLLSRISMARMPHRDQLWAILHAIDFYRPKAFAMDKTGLGLPLFQELQEHMDAFKAQDWDKIPPWMRRYDLELALTTIKGYNFSEKLIVDFDQSIEVSQFEDPVAKAGLRRNAKEFGTDVLREMVDRQQILLPWDDELLKQFQGGTWTSARSMDAYGRRMFSRGNDHCVAAGTLVETEEGPTPIEDIRAGDWVVTRGGVQRVLLAWQAAASAPVIELRTEGGHVLTVTPDHRLLTNRGWVQARELSAGDLVITLSLQGTFVPRRLEGQREMDHKPAVYDLTVENEHEFVASGIVVLNCLDASRMMALGWSQHAIEELLRNHVAEPVFDSILTL